MQAKSHKKTPAAHKYSFKLIKPCVVELRGGGNNSCVRSRSMYSVCDLSHLSVNSVSPL